MPGPGGGSRGGGFSGGSRGGGFSGGSRGGFHGGGMHYGPRGPMHHGPHHHHHGPIFFGPRFHRPHHHGGGCFGSLVGAFVAIPMLIIFSIIFIFAAISGNVEFNDTGYNEQVFETYADEQYYAIFSETENYEENILLVFTVDEGYDNYNYNCIAWLGYDLNEDVRDLFGNEYTEFGRKVQNSIPKYYEHSLSVNLRDITNHMANKVSAITGAPAGSVDTSFSKLVNNSSLNISESTVNSALVSFTEKTGINIAIVVANGEDVFGSAGEKNEDLTTLLGLIVVVIIVVIAILISKNSNKGDKNKQTTDKTDPNAGQGRYDPNTGTYV